MDIPKHWKKVPLRELVIAEKGKKPQRLKPKRFDDSVPYLDIEAVEKNNILQYADTYSTVLATEGDLFVVWDGSRSGLVAKGMIGAVGSTIMRLTPILVNRDYLFYYLKSNYEAIQNNTVGSSIPHVNPKFFYSLIVPLPSLEEQKRIVEALEVKLNEYQKDFDIAKNKLDEMDDYRKSILEQGITGSLTNEWRNSYSKDLIEIDYRKEKNEKITHFNIKQGKSVNLEENINSLFVLPNKWQWVKLGDIVYSVKDGPHYTPKYVKKGIPFISSGNVKPEGIDFTNTKFISPELHKELSVRCKPEKGDVLYTKGGTTGIARVNSYDIEFNVWVHIAVLKTIPSVNPFYLQYALNSAFCYEQSQKYTHGAGNQDLGLTRMIFITLPLPPFHEQAEIVRQVGIQLAKTHEIEIQNSNSIQQIERLQKSVFQMAFYGSLTELQSNDKSVIDFLEKIKIEKQRIYEERKEFQKSNLKIRIQMKEIFMEQKSILDILSSADSQTLTVEELWEEMPFSKNNEVETFYEELIKLEQSEKIEISWFDDKNIRTNITLT